MKLAARILFMSKTSGKTRAAGRKEGQLAARILFMSNPSGKSRAEGRKDSSRCVLLFMSKP
jgi:hypothetical protein